MKTNSPLSLLFKSMDKYLKRKLVFSFVLLTFLSINLFAQPANIIIQPAATTTTVGQSFTVAVRVDFTGTNSPQGADVVEVHLTFDKTKLQVTNITKSAIAVLPSEAIPLQSISTINTNGQINYNAGTSSNFPTADFDFLTITFSAVSGGGTTSPLTFLTTFPKTDVIRNFTSILGSAINGTVNIQNCTQPTATISAPSNASICNGQPVGLKLASATGVSPYTLIVDGVTYPNITVGSTFASIPFPTYNIWPSNPTPATQNGYDNQPIEVGTKFRSTTTGFVKGMRVFIGATNTGTAYTCKLWNPNNTTTPIASATFTPGSAGWQQVLFSSPVSIAANTTYVASYYSASGKYVNTDNYFSGFSATNGPLTALQDGGVGGANGVYRLGAGGGYPSNTFSSANYWVDLVFTSNTNSFNLTSVTDNTGCNRTGALQTLNVLSVDCSTLPVTLLNLSASPQGNKVTLRWSTSSEMNNRGFDIQRSTDGVNWTTIGFVAGAGNSPSVTNYTYMDQNLEPVKYFYRLKQIDIDNQYKYSAIVTATLNSKAEFVLGQNYPNPFNNQTTIQFILPKAVNVNLSLFDVSGRVVRVLVNGAKDAGTHAINFNTGTLTRGVYYYKIQAGDFTDVKKLTIQ